MDYYNLNFIESIKKINADFNLNLQIDECKSNIKPKKPPLNHNNNLPENVMKYIKLRCILEDTAKYVGLKTDDKNNIVFEYKNELGKHIANKYRPAKQLRKNDLKMWFQEGTNANTLYNMDKINITESLVITEGEFDSLALIESGYKNTVSVPTGANSYEWIDINWDWLNQFKEIIIWFDNDNPGIEGARNVSSKLSNEIVKTVNSTKANDINEILHKYGKETVLEELSKAIEIPIPDIITTDFIADYNAFEAPKIKTGIKYFDEDRFYGFLFGTLNIITGESGAGKSTLINQMCIAETISQGYKVLLYTGEIPKPDLKYWLIQTIVNENQLKESKSKDGIIHYKANEQATKIISHWLNDKLYIYNKEFGTSGDEILSKMELLAKRKDVKCFILDNLMTIDIGNERDINQAKKSFVIRLKQFAIKYNAIIHLVAHTRKLAKGESAGKADVAGSSTITNMADYIMLIQKNKPKEGETKSTNTIEIQKNRPFGKLGFQVLEFSIKRKRFHDMVQTQLKKDYGYANNQEMIQVSLRECPF